MIISTLPILTNLNRDNFEEWHIYYEKVYKKPVTKTVDLNNFNWFYWFSPLGNIETVVINIDDSPIIKCIMNQAYIFTYKSEFFPEPHLSKVGFFVKRNINKNIFNNNFLEVFRTCQSVFEEKGACWFFLTIGSGYFLKCDECPIVTKRFKISSWNEEAPFKSLFKNNIKILISIDSIFIDLGLYEIIYRLNNNEEIANTAKLPLFIGDSDSNIPYTHKYDILTKCMF